MGNTAITARGLSKQYKIGAPQRRHATLRDHITEALAAPLRSLRAKPAVSRELNTIWALKDVSFDVKEGEVVGVIGRNGAGKSTLLKVLARITEPTKGYADIRGRVGSLLEVGTGFHPELTGRENVYLNGAILGMRREEIVRKFDEIVAFAEIEKFLDTPAKRYSTGMYMRLGFAVAANLDPEILVVDEVLAVGDAAFQKKCLAKMAGVAKEGRTVIFVSHNMAAVQSLCTRCMVIDGGQLRIAGSLQEGITMYHQSISSSAPEAVVATKEVSIVNLTVNGGVGTPVDATKPMRFEFDLASRVSFSGFRMFLILDEPGGNTVLHSVINEHTNKDIDGPGFFHLAVDVPALWVTPGMYSAQVKLICNGVGLKGRYFSERLLVMMESADYDPDSAAGILSPRVNWNVTSNESLEVESLQ